MEARRIKKRQNRRRQRNNTKINEMKNLFFVKINKTGKLLDKLTKKKRPKFKKIENKRKILQHLSNKFRNYKSIFFSYIQLS